MAKLFADENFPLPVVEGRRRLGHDVVTLQESGRSGQWLADETVLQLAEVVGRALRALNRKDFLRLHGAGAEHAGIIACTFDLDFSGQAARIHAELLRYPTLATKLIRVNRPAR